MGTQPPTSKGTEPPIFGPRLLWPNGCMDQDATWCGGRPRPIRRCVRWGASSPSPKGTQPPSQFSVNVRGVAKRLDGLLLGMDVGLGPGDFVFDGDQATHRKKAPHPHSIFGPCLLWPNGWMYENATWYRSRTRPRSQLAPRKVRSSPHSFRPMFILATVAHLSYC